MTTIPNLPLDVHAYGIIPFLTERDTRAFALVSKDTYKIVDASKDTCQRDVTLWDEKTTAIPKTMSGLFCLKLKTDLLLKMPKRIFSLLYPIREAVQKDNGNPNDILVLYQKACEVNRKAIPVIVIFDYDTMQIPARGLAIALEEAVTEWPRFVRAIFAHPKATEITASGLGTALKFAVLYNFEKVVRMILAQPNAAKIPFTDKDGLKDALILAEQIKNPKMIKTLSDFIKKSRGEHRSIEN
jgi:hypothetical protein